MSQGISPLYLSHSFFPQLHVLTLVSPVSRGKGTPRRKAKKVHKSAGTDDKKLQGALKKLNVQPIQGIEEVNMFKEDGNVIHFSAPKGTRPSILCATRPY